MPTFVLYHFKPSLMAGARTVWHIGSEMERLVTKLPMRLGEMDLAMLTWSCGVGDLGMWT
jgi:hypothetical protein